MTAGRVQPQMPAPFLILMSMLTVWFIGLGLGPKVMLEVLVVPDSTALITAFERLAAAFAVEALYKNPEAETKDMSIKALKKTKI